MLDACFRLSSAKPRRIARVWREPSGRVRVLTGHASRHLTKGGRRYNQILRFRRRVGTGPSAAR